MMTTRSYFFLAILSIAVMSASAFTVGKRHYSHVAFNTEASPSARSFRSYLFMSTETQHDLKQYEEATATAVMESSAIAPPQNKSGEEEKEQSQSQKLMAKVKEAGTAGIVSYALWELAFWFISIPVCILGYQKVTGHWPDLSNGEDQAQLGAEAFAFVNFARFAVPLRIGLALSTTPWIQENIVDRFMKNKDDDDDDNNKHSSNRNDDFDIPIPTMDYQKQLLSNLKRDERRE